MHETLILFGMRQFWILKFEVIYKYQLSWKRKKNLEIVWEIASNKSEKFF